MRRRKPQPRFWVKLAGKYWQEHRYGMGRWVRNKAVASKVRKDRAEIYLRDWKKFGAKLVRVR